MFRPGEVHNPDGRNGKEGTTQQLRAALDRAAKGRHTTIYDEIATLFFTSAKWKMAILPYITPKLRTLEVSGEVSVPFQFIIETSAGVPVTLPQPRKQIDSNVLPNLVSSTTKHKPTHIAKRKVTKPRPKPAVKKRAHTQ